MPETKQVGFQCHTPNQERWEFHSSNGLAQLPTSWTREERVSPMLHGEATENQVAILGPAQQGEEAEPGFRL